ncbi:MAG: GNAT family N-acetyltransferase [Acidobacteria bacterium]|nr:MAG: GNAT family N-acetyltransferase [Acidobacteriota bacterium]PYR75131.1 MAG: GNAT family N-acetyltransferase [Acidobacteriota bacterium]
MNKDVWWAHDRTREQVENLLTWSDLVIGLCDDADDRLVAFARVLTDRTFRAFIFDVIVAAEHRGRGVGRRLMEELLSHPIVRAVELVELYCRPDLVTFYEGFGFTSPDSGVVLMRRRAYPILNRLRHPGC